VVVEATNFISVIGHKADPEDAVVAPGQFVGALKQWSPQFSGCESGHPAVSVSWYLDYTVVKTQKYFLLLHLFS